MLLIDAHVHIYGCFDLGKFFNSAFTNFKSAAEHHHYGNDFTGILLLAETSKDDWFNRLANYAGGDKLPDNRTTGTWTFDHTNENISLLARSGDLNTFILVAGRQIVTKEDIEVVALCNSDRFIDGKPILEVIREIEEKDGIPVIPWGVGKWFGRRGRIVKKIINDHTSLIYLGDNRNRPNFWLQPKLFKLAKQKGICVLPGSDPLPFKSESCRAGSYGFSIKRHIDPKRPGRFIKQTLRDAADSVESQFGRLENNYRFLINQMRMQIAKRYLKTTHS